eukprot:SAG22_NODE_773_length_7297_cov_102.041539_4_plen_208_part_00
MTCDPGETPRELVRRLRRDRPAFKPFQPLALLTNQYRVTRGPYVLLEDMALAAQGISDLPKPMELSLVFCPKGGMPEAAAPKEMTSWREMEKGERIQGYPLRATDGPEGSEEHGVGLVDAVTASEPWFLELVSPYECLPEACHAHSDCRSRTATREQVLSSRLLPAWGLRLAPMRLPVQCRSPSWRRSGRSSRRRPRGWRQFGSEST